MRKWSIALLLALCLLLAAGCGRQAGTDAAPPGPLPQVETVESGQTESAEANEAPQEPTQAERRAAAIQRAAEVEEAQRLLDVYFDAFRLTHPHSDVCLVGASTGSEVVADCTGCDLPELEASGLLPDCVRLKYTLPKTDARDAAPIPREPETMKRFDNGLTVTMERGEYPLFPEYAAVTLTAESPLELGNGWAWFLEKYVDGEWMTVPYNYNIFDTAHTLRAGESFRLVIPLSRLPLGAGLYRLTVSGEYPVEFTVTEEAEPLDLTGIEEQLRVGALFRILPLPENLTNAIEDRELLSWPLLSASYSAPSHENAIARLRGRRFQVEEEQLGELTLLRIEETPFTLEEEKPVLVNTYPTASPLSALKALLEGLGAAGERLTLTKLEYRHFLYYGRYPTPMWLLWAETESGETQLYGADTLRVRGESVFRGEMIERAEVLAWYRKVVPLFEAYREAQPDADVYPVDWRGDMDGAHWFLRLRCDGVDIPALESSGLLPDFVRLEYDHEKFNQKQAHEIPREPEWVKAYNGGGTVIAMEQADWPLYPDELRFTVRVNAPTQYSPRIEKWADGEWHGVRSTITDTLEMRYVETEENSFSLTHYAKLGPGLYRLHINSLYWVEFTVSAG